MPQLFDRQSGQPVSLPPDQATAGLVSGALTLDADSGPVPLLGANGTVFRADPNHVADILSKHPEAYRLLSHEE